MSLPYSKKRYQIWITRQEQKARKMGKGSLMIRQNQAMLGELGIRKQGSRINIRTKQNEEGKNNEIQIIFTLFRVSFFCREGSLAFTRLHRSR
jgi:hypothetical protein